MTQPPLVAIVGDAALDLSFAVPTFEGIDEKVPPTESSRELGGTGANSATAVVRFGGRARLHAHIGNDPIGSSILEQLNEHGVDTSGVSIVEGRSTVAVILRGPARRLVVVDRGVADSVTGFDPAIIASGAALIYLSAMPWAVVRSVILTSRVPVVVGIEARQASELAEFGNADAAAKVLDGALVVLTNEAGAEAVADPLSHLRKAVLVVTRGAAGARIVTPDNASQEIPAPAVRVVDATGAGDSFAGALCQSLVRGGSIEDAVRLATVAASLSTETTGAQAGFPTWAEVLARSGDRSG